MSRFPLLMILFSVLVLIGCSEQSGTSGGGGTTTSSSGGTTTTSSSGGTTTSSSGGTTTSSTGGPDPDPTDDFPSSGIPDQNSLTVLVETFNPQARDKGNTIVPISVLLADQLGNSNTIPDGTQIYFAADGGAIQSSGTICTTIDGGCSTNWRSQNPIPLEGPAIVDPLGSGEMVVSHSSGRATVLVWTVGIESFTDNNSNGLFDDAGATPDVQIDDVGDPFLDKNESNVRDGGEEFVDFPIPQLGAGGTYTLPDGLYSGPNCAFPNECATGINAQSLFIFQNVEIAMSSNEICIVPVDPGAGFWDSNVAFVQPVDLKNDRAAFHFLIHDCYGNPPMSGTTVSFSSDRGRLFDDGGTVPNTTVDMGGTPPATPLGRVGTRMRYPANSLVYSAFVLEDPANPDPEFGALEIDISNAAGDFGAFVQLLDPAM